MRFLGIPSLRWRLVAVMCLAYILVAATTEIAGYSAQRANLRSEVQSRARSDAAILAAGSVSSLSTHAEGTLQSFVASLQRDQGVTHAAIIGENGRIIASTRASEIGRPHQLPFPTQAYARSLPNGDFEGIAPIVQGTALGLADIVVSGASVQTELNRLVLIETTVRVLGLVIFFLLSLVIAQYILGPLAAMARATSAIRRGNLAARISLRDGTELQTVAEAFNDMAAALQRRIEHLSFLATSGSVLPNTFRSGGDVGPILEGFCRELGAAAAGLVRGEDSGDPSIWWSADGRPDVPVRALLAARGEKPEGTMAVPVLGDASFVVLQADSRPFTAEEQQVITNFAYQIGIAADNARLFEEQQEALRVKDQFLSIVSHELRTPLTTIKGYAQMLRRKVAGERDAERFADNIDAQTSRLGRLVDDLLDVTRFTRGQFELMPKHMDLRPLLEEAVARFRVVSPTHPIELVMDRGPSEGEWDRDRLEQVLNNLLGNAIKYSPDGGQIAVILRHEGDDLVVAIQDQGMGIPAEDQQQLFERFFRGRAEGQEIKGLGLGLYVTRRIVEAHGGEIGVESRPGEGSTFTFRLPLSPVAQLSV